MAAENIIVSQKLPTELLQMIYDHSDAATKATMNLTSTIFRHYKPEDVQHLACAAVYRNMRARFSAVPLLAPALYTPISDYSHCVLFCIGNLYRLYRRWIRCISHDGGGVYEEMILIKNGEWEDVDL